MILIISRVYDKSTSWLRHHKISYKRINSSSEVTFGNIIINNKKIDFVLRWNNLGEEVEVKFLNISACWYRRGNISLPFIGKLNKNNFLDNQLFQYLRKEQVAVRDFIIKMLARKENSIGNYFDNETIKNVQLVYAKSVGLNIPKTIVTTEIDYIKNKILKGISFITKGINSSAFLPSEFFSIGGLTSKIRLEHFADKKRTGFSLYQELIEKQFEIRVFYLHNKCHSMAIFSQNDEKTKIDFRDYNYDKRNRTVPYKLPDEMEKKISILMKKLNMNSGSIDIIYSRSNNYVFLEVNPVGQFGMVSKPCNYFLERLIAKHLSKYEKKN